jgi:tetratricopeptide (TPR) repeat protein
LLLLLLFWAAPSWGDPPAGLEDQAHAHYLFGKSAYDNGRYQEAIQQFEAGYALMHKPAFLLNLGQSHRHLGHYKKALALYRQYLDETTADAPLREQAKQIIRELEVEAGDERSPAPPAEPSPPPAQPTPQATSPLVVDAHRQTAPAAPRRSRKGVWIGVGVGIVAVVGVGLGLGLGLGLSNGSSFHSTLPDVSLGGMK